LYALRIFVITGFYHRYFSHKTFKTSRVAQFIFALLGGLCVQRGALWWAAHHRNHHRYSDEPQDPHSPKQYGFWWAHMGWITNKSNFPTRLKLVPDLAKYPELMWLNRFDLVVPVLFAVSLYVGGILLQKFFPHLGTSGGQMLVWGFFISTVFLFHATGTINSLAHRWGSRRFETKDTSRNNFWLALLTFGEGWHNNHHEYPATPRQGFYWWEIDLTYYLLKVLEKLGIIWDLKPVPSWVYQKAKNVKLSPITFLESDIS
ncbi:MAG: acyl-CoA desaturase, partial [Deltaproteobacteria bacterium]|nr:acyl-CoA desaturase [Deltaproteobacteria bacterium]